MASIFNRVGGRRIALVGLLTSIGAFGGSAVVQGAAGGPQVTRDPSVQGTLRVGQTVSAGGYGWDGPSGTSISFQWLRCPDATNVYDCSLLNGSTGQSYKLVNEDSGKRMRVALIVRRNNDYDYGISGASNPVAAASAPTPTVTPAPAPAATPVATPTPDQTFDVPVATPVPTSGGVLHQTATSKKAKMLKPFPTVRIRGRLTANGANVTSLTVRAPRGVQITVTCSGSGCPARKIARGAKVTHLSTFERVLPSGVRLTITIAKSGYVAKVTVLRFRRGAVPLRSDACLYPGHRKTQRCPGG